MKNKTRDTIGNWLIGIALAILVMGLWNEVEFIKIGGIVAIILITVGFLIKPKEEKIIINTSKEDQNDN